MPTCPECGKKLSAFFRIPTSWTEATYGGWTCPDCGCRLDRRGRPRLKTVEPSEDTRPVRVRPTTGIEVEVAFFPLYLVLVLCRPTIVIDGKAHRMRWGEYFFVLEPGRHTIRVFFRYLFIKECGANSIDVVVEEGKITRVRYLKLSPFAWPGVLSKGRIEEL